MFDSRKIHKKDLNRETYVGNISTTFEFLIKLN